MFNLHKIKGTQVYAFTIEGKLTTSDLEEFHCLLKQTTKEHQKIKLLAEFKEFPGFESFKAFSKTFKLKLEAISKIEKYAVVSDAGWIKTFTPLGNLLTPQTPIKHFSRQQKNDAIAWLNKTKVNT